MACETLANYVFNRKRERSVFALNYVLSFHKCIAIDEKVVQEANAYLDYGPCRLYIPCYLHLGIHNVVTSPHHDLNSILTEIRKAVFNYVQQYTFTVEVQYLNVIKRVISRALIHSKISCPSRHIS